MGTLYKSEAGAREVQQRYRDALRAWPVPADHRRLPTRQGDTFVVVSGPQDAPPVVLLHGSGANATTWQYDIAAWAQHLRTYAVDLIGEPGLSAPARPPLTTDAHARWLDDVLDGLGISSTAIVGTSLGGWAALDYATRRPHRVSRLALLCPAGLGRQKWGWLATAMLRRLLGPSAQRRGTAAASGLDPSLHQEALDTVTHTFARFNPRTERIPLITDDALQRLRLPLQVIVGEHDVLFDSHDTARRIRRCVPHAGVTMLARTGHAILGQTENVLSFLRN